MAECEKPKCFQKFSTTIFQNALKNEIKYQKYVQKSGSLLLNYILTDFGVSKIILVPAKKTHGFKPKHPKNSLIHPN
jgi:hypothetical protein